MTNAVTVAQSGSNNVTFRNRIINGACVIDQRNAGASFTPTSGNYGLDRYRWFVSQASKITAQQSTTVPSGFSNSLYQTVAAAVTPGASDYFVFQQNIEGYNIADMQFGTASAQTFTVSFWVRSSVTGTYSVYLANASVNRTYLANYTVNSANTWEQKTITIAGDQSGTWGNTNGGGIMIGWDLGSGSTYNGTANTWQAGQYYRTSSSVNWISTAGATFYITGVQLEAGTTASPFEYRQYGTELLLCQRYYETSAYPDVTFTSASMRGGVCFTGGNTASGYNFLVPKRSNSPTVTLYSRSNASGAVSLVATGADVTGCTASGLNATGFRIIALGSAQTAGAGIESGWTVSSEL